PTPKTAMVIRSLGGSWPSEAAFFPIVAEGKVVAVLYADNVSTDAPMPETEGLEIFISHAGLALEKSLLQRRLHEMEKRKGVS
ncbi:MAG: response regulator receiver, partial [Nitrospirae bacterium]|nr:response regulator receiver [Nitrospirota bacterium]